jgi:hypothetical protein
VIDGAASCRISRRDLRAGVPKKPTERSVGNHLTYHDGGEPLTVGASRLRVWHARRTIEMGRFAGAARQTDATRADWRRECLGNSSLSRTRLADEQHRRALGRRQQLDLMHQVAPRRRWAQERRCACTSPVEQGVGSSHEAALTRPFTVI